MANLTEQDVISPFIGKKIIDTLPDDFAQDDGETIVICNIDYKDEEEYQKMFGITDALLDKWDCRGIVFNLYIERDDDSIADVEIHKYTDEDNWHGRPITNDLTPTQQDLRIARRILSYITTQ